MEGVMQKKIFIPVLCLWCTLVGSAIPSALASDLVWQTSLQAATDLARQQNKYILLLAGRDT